MAASRSASAGLMTVASSSRCLRWTSCSCTEIISSVRWRSTFTSSATTPWRALACESGPACAAVAFCVSTSAWYCAWRIMKSRCAWAISASAEKRALSPSCSASADLIFASRVASASPMVASRFTSAVRRLPRALRYSSSSLISWIVSTSTPRPIFSRSAAASLVSFWAKLWRSLLISSTVSVPRMDRRWPSSVWKITRWIWSCVMPRNRSAAACSDVSSLRIFTFATALTDTGTPFSV